MKEIEELENSLKKTYETKNNYMKELNALQESLERVLTYNKQWSLRHYRVLQSFLDRTANIFLKDNTVWQSTATDTPLGLNLISKDLKLIML